MALGFKEEIGETLLVSGQSSQAFARAAGDWAICHAILRGLVEDISDSALSSWRRVCVLVVGRMAARKHAGLRSTCRLSLARSGLVQIDRDELAPEQRGHRLAARGRTPGRESE